MKNLCNNFIIICICLWGYNMNAQTKSFGGHIGINIANVEIDLGDGGGGFSFSPDSKTGITLGAAFNIGISELFSVQPELNFIQKGYKVSIEDPFTGNTTEGKLTLNYLELPILGKVSFGSETIKGFVIAGPSFGLGLNGKTDANGMEQDFEFGNDENSDYTKRADFGINIGGGVGYNTGPGQLFIDVRYYLGVLNIDDSPDPMGATTKHKGTQIKLGYLVPFGS